MSDELKLIEPSAEFEASYRSYVDESRAADELLVPWVLGYDVEDFPAFLERLSDAAVGKNVPDIFVAHSTYWTIDSTGQVVGVVNLRHELNESLLLDGGHIGYSIRPSLRGRGLATRQLALAVQAAADRGIGRVLVICQRDNQASAEVIRKNGGVMESEVFSPETGKMMQRYWIDT
ncbi:MAG: GNAT family N-acetyltransferase [Phycisphaerales bacterium]|jgi:predicted acetyltransferase|nr:GNAT family N-acetyltransferase [Phycisphaerales bacterium]